MPHECFISYASLDVALAETLYRRLTDAGVDVWFDRARLRPGFNWQQEIESHCEKCRVVLPLLTPRWKLSEWTRYETYGAEAVIPLLVAGAYEDVVTPPLKKRQRISLKERWDDDAAWNELIDAVREHIARPAPD
ncbi:MAG: toll/interleukin-1 receptor domain-containing protein, partial [Silvibacterium sp.]